MSDLHAYFETQQNQMTELLRQFVEIETPTAHKAAVDQFADLLEQQCRNLEASITRHPRETVGDILHATWNGDADGKPILILSHMDTVWPLGTLALRPVHLDADGRFYGPGAVDMKGGIVIALNAIRGLIEQGAMPARPIWYLLTSDEEDGSSESRELIEQLALQCAVVLVTEPPNRDGSLKTWRKGVARYELSVQGRAAHAGNEPEEGVNAIIEFAQHAMELHKLNDLKNGISVNTTLVQGGVSSNTIPPQVSATVDVRALKVSDFERLHERIAERFPYIPGAKVRAERLHYRPPMERHEQTIQRVKAIGAQVGFTVREEGAGGGSDGNFTAAQGIPTVDGLGAEGGGLHAEHEHVLLSSLPRKATLLAALLRDWAAHESA